MKWFWKWIGNKLNNSQREEVVMQKCYSTNGVAIGSSNNGIKSMNFEMTMAQGGVIFRANHYEHKTDQHATSLHIIHDNEDIAQEVGRLVALELMRL